MTRLVLLFALSTIGACTGATDGPATKELALLGTGHATTAVELFSADRQTIDAFASSIHAVLSRQLTSGRREKQQVYLNANLGDRTTPIDRTPGMSYERLRSGADEPAFAITMMSCPDFDENVDEYDFSPCTALDGERKVWFEATEQPARVRVRYDGILSSGDHIGGAFLVSADPNAIETGP